MQTEPLLKALAKFGSLKLHDQRQDNYVLCVNERGNRIQVFFAINHLQLLSVVFTKKNFRWIACIEKIAAFEKFLKI